MRIKKIVCFCLAVLCAVMATGCSTAQPLETKVSLQPLETDAPTQPTETSAATQPAETSVPTQPAKTDPSAPADEAISKIVFSQKLLGIAKLTPQEWVDDLTATGDGQYVDIYINEDGVSVTLEITEDQRAYWITSYEGFFTKLQNDFSAVNPNYKLERSDDCTHFDITYNLELDPYYVIYYVIYAEVICASLQAITGVPAEDWYVSCTVYNCDTGKFVANGDSETGLAYEEADWERSYSEE